MPTFSHLTVDDDLDLSIWPESALKVGTRKSQLALIQTESVITRIQIMYPKIKFEIVKMNTAGDINLEVPLAKIGDKSLFTKELEQALLNGEVDFVVHSLKDLPTQLPKGLIIAGITEREDPRDALVLPEGKTVPACPDGGMMDIRKCFPEGSVIGTSSSRRVAAIRSLCPTWKVRDIRGNVNTRLQKLDAPNSQYTAIILAAAGLQRMGLGHRISRFLEKDSEDFDWPYAVGQGALGLECAEDNRNVAALLNKLTSADTYYACVAERALLYTFGGGCSIPLGVRSSFGSDDRHLVNQLRPFTLEAYHFGENSVVKASGTTGMSLKAEFNCDTAEAEMTAIQAIPFEGIPISNCSVVAALGLKIGRALRRTVMETVEERPTDGRGDGDGPRVKVICIATPSTLIKWT